MNWKKFWILKIHGLLKKLKLESNKIQKLKAVAKYIMSEHLKIKNSYLMTFRIYNTLDNSEVDRIKMKKVRKKLISL